MEKFIVSARKYRPATFASVVGQKHITSTLKNAIERNQLAHAYLFCGPRGVGKTTCARIFAKAINCLSPNGAEACNECDSCRSFNEGRSLNIHELDAASNNSIDDIRNLIDQVRVMPQVGRLIAVQRHGWRLLTLEATLQLEADAVDTIDRLILDIVDVRATHRLDRHRSDSLILVLIRALRELELQRVRIDERCGDKHKYKQQEHQVGHC